MDVEPLVGKPIKLKFKNGDVLEGTVHLLNPGVEGSIPFLTFDRVRELREHFGISDSQRFFSLPLENARQFIELIPIRLIEGYEMMETVLHTIHCVTTNGKEIGIHNMRLEVEKLDDPPCVRVRYKLPDHDTWFDVGNIQITNGTLRVPISVAFISYASEDKEEIAKISRKLNDYGIVTWFDRKDLLPGEDWEMKIEQAIEKADYFLLFLSRRTLDKIGFRNREIQLALRQQSYRPRGMAYIIPVLLDECEPPYDLRNLQWLKATEDTWFKRLIVAIAPSYIKDHFSQEFYQRGEDLAPLHGSMEISTEVDRARIESEPMPNPLETPSTACFVVFAQGREVDRGTDLDALVQRFSARHRDVPASIARISATGARVDLSPETLQFCLQQRILPYVQWALDMIEQCFAPIDEVQVRAEQDPETEDAWLVLEVVVHNEIDEVLRQYDTYTDQWIAAVPWPDRSKIRLSYGIV